MAKKRKRISTSESATGGLGSLGDYLQQAGYAASGEKDESEPTQAVDEKDSTLPEFPSQSEKVVVRTERKGRSGKTVTIVAGLQRSDAELEELAKKMRKRLGCGSTVEGTHIVLQGDLVDRVKHWLGEE
ncbi:MAG: translation initiation factor [Proteobacteria bacterium]|nr:translation initiation factor [Pseudomonadota bacterium]